MLREIAAAVPIYAGASRQALGATGARWPLAVAASNGAGPSVRGTPCLTWSHLERGLTAGSAAEHADPAALTSGREERADV